MRGSGAGRGLILRLGPAIVASVTVLAGCGWYGDSIPELSRLAVSKQPTGDLAIHYISCADEEVEQVMLGLSDEGFSKNVATLWRINSASGSDISLYEVGTTPEGFVEVVPLRDTIDSADPLSARVVSSKNGTTLFNLRAEDVPTTGVLQSGGKTQSLSDFEHDAAASC